MRHMLIGKWQLWCYPFSKSIHKLDSAGWHIFELGLIKLTSIPGEGYVWSKKNYQGFIIKFTYWLPIDRA